MALFGHLASLVVDLARRSDGELQDRNLVETNRGVGEAYRPSSGAAATGAGGAQSLSRMRPSRA